MAQLRSGDSRSSKQWRCHKRRSAAQPRVFSGLREFDRRSCGGLGERALRQRGTKRWLHQGPGLGYLAANIYALRIQPIHNHGKPQPQISRGGLDGADSSGVTGVCSRYQIADCEPALNCLLAGPRHHFGQISAKVTSKRCKIGDMGFPTTSGAAQTVWSGYVECHMPKFACHVVVAPHELAVNDNANADTVGHADMGKAMRSGGPLTACPHLRK